MGTETLAGFLSLGRIRSLSGPAALQRGQSYFASGRVQSVVLTAAGIRARVRGQRTYTVVLEAVGGELDYDCDCPMGEQGDFCKHCVAAALATVKNPPKEKERTLPLAGILPFLEAETPARLAALILEWAADDPLLQQRLLLYRASLSGPDAAIAAARLSFESAARPRHYISYRETTAFVNQLDRAVDTFEDLLGRGYAAQVLDLCEDALVTLSHTIDMVEDDTELFDISDRLAEIHLDACKSSAQDPIQLAARLFRLELHPGISVFDNAAEIYQDLLGPTGLTAYRDLANITVFERNADRVAILESVARATGRAEDRIAVLSHDLSTPYRFSLILEVCVAAGDHELALFWAERGYKTYPADTSIRDALANEYHHLGRHQDAVRLIWKSYTESPGLPLYRALKRHATLAGDWPEYRDNALGLIRRRIAASKPRQDHSALVEILMDEGSVEQAWHEAETGGCSSHLWLALADLRANDHPGDSAPIYIQRAELELSRGNNTNYETPVALLLRAAKLMRRIEALPHFRRHLASLRQLHKSKRKFLQLLDHHRDSLEFPKE